MYDGYTAYEAETFGDAERQKFNVQSSRKSRSFYDNAQGADGFDAVITPVVFEPVVQSTLYLKVKYEAEQAAAK